MTAQSDSWDRWKRGWQHALFVLPLTIPLAGSSLLSSPAGELAAGVALLAVLVGWYAYWYGPWPRRPAGRVHSATALYLAGATVVWLALILVAPGFWIAGFALLVPLGMRHPAPVAIAVAVCGTLWLTHRATATPPVWPEIVASALTVGAAITFVGYVSALDRAGRTKAKLLDELAMAHVNAAAAERRAGTLAERQRLAREVHDTLTQGFASIVMLLEAIQERRTGPDDATSLLDRHIETALRTARDNLTESRRLVWALQPAPLDDTGSLPDAIMRQTRQLTNDTGIAVSTVVTGEPESLPAATEAAVLRIAQEALTNARQHANATTMTVTLSYSPDVLLVDIADDGTGLPAGRPDTGMGTGLGLRAMRQRASGLGATLTVESEPGRGTTVALAVPIEWPATLRAQR